MTREIIATVLETEGAKASSKGFTLTEAQDVTCFVSTPGDILPIARVVKVEARDKYVCLETSKGERFLFAYEDVLGFKLGAAATTKDRPSGVGFSR